MSDVLERLQPVFRDVFDQPSLTVTRATTARTVEGWDSLAHITLIDVVQREFGVRFALGELEELKNVGDMVDLIVRKLGTGWR
ncbi:MAG TPA: acyl carrier protein [Gemmatimonadaceae bacterium]|nr:acyl carrier protein [Gemmatimonadaceae bacterium]